MRPSAGNGSADLARLLTGSGGGGSDGATGSTTDPGRRGGKGGGIILISVNRIVSAGNWNGLHIRIIRQRQCGLPPQIDHPHTTASEPGGWTDKTLIYSQDKPHAVTELKHNTISLGTYADDANGNTPALPGTARQRRCAAGASVTCRVEDGKTYNQLYNGENQLEVVQLPSQGNYPDPNEEADQNVAASWYFIYDGDGNRVRQEYFELEAGDIVAMKVSSYCAGGSFEMDQSGFVQADDTILISVTNIRKYYSFAGMTVAMNDGSGLNYFLTDHLGSVIAIVNSIGSIVSQQSRGCIRDRRYYPFGGVRSDVGSVTQTDFGYTGQRNLDVQGNNPLGLMDYHARFYDAYITHFSKPDTIIPDLYNPQALNRYSYTSNNPL